MSNEYVKRVMVDAAMEIAHAKDRIFLSYLKERGLTQDYAEWMRALNDDEKRMNKLIVEKI